MPEKIHVKAMCVFFQEDKILVKQSFDPHTKETFYRPAGGSVEHGEHTTETLVREMREELGAEITLPEFIGVLEGIFEFDGKKHHQIAFIYDAKFIDPKFYKMQEIPLDENGMMCKAYWKPLSFFIQKQAPLHPEGLLELLMK